MLSQDVSDESLAGTNAVPEAGLTSGMGCAQGQANSAAAGQADMGASDAPGCPSTSEAAADEEELLPMRPRRQASKFSGAAAAAEGAKSEVQKSKCRKAAKVRRVCPSALYCCFHNTTRSRRLLNLLPTHQPPVLFYPIELALLSVFYFNRLFPSAYA